MRAVAPPNMSTSERDARDMKDEAGGGDDAATVAERLLLLAQTFHEAAGQLLAGGRAVGAPGRVCAIHAIELYLSAFLAQGGMAEADIRRMGHDLASREAAVTQRGLRFKQRTAAHLAAMTREREYVALRYRRIRADALAPESRMLATLNEVSQKVRRSVARPV